VTNITDLVENMLNPMSQKKVRNISCVLNNSFVLTIFESSNSKSANISVTEYVTLSLNINGS